MIRIFSALLCFETFVDFNGWVLYPFILAKDYWNFDSFAIVNSIVLNFTH